MENIENYIARKANNDIELREKSLVCPLSITFISIALIALGILSVLPGEYLSMLSVILGICMLIIGIVKTANACGKGKYIPYYVGNGERLKREALYIKSEDFGRVNEALKTRNMERIVQIEKQMQSSTRLDIWGVASGDYYLVQILKYSEFLFVPDSEVFVLQGSVAQEFRKLLEK